MCFVTEITSPPIPTPNEFFTEKKRLGMTFPSWSLGYHNNILALKKPQNVRLSVLWLEICANKYPIFFYNKVRI